MLKLKLSGSARGLLKGFTIRLLVGVILFTLFSSSLVLTASAAGPDGCSGWTYCADEGNTCSFSGTMEVRYWGYDDNSQTHYWLSNKSCYG